MKVNLIRVDERLIHGQVMTSWCKKHWIKRIILIDDEIAQDEFMASVLEMSAPAGVKVSAMTVLDAANELTNDSSDISTLLLFKDLKCVLDLVNSGYQMKELDIGNIGSSPVRKPLTREVYISEDEKSILRKLIENGVHVYIQKLPQDNQVDVKDKI